MKELSKAEQFRREAVLIHGHVRDKFRLIKIASAKFKARYKIKANVEVIKASDYDPEIDGHLCVGEWRSAFFAKGGNVIEE